MMINMEKTGITPATTLNESGVSHRSYNIINTHRRANTYPVIDCGQFINPDSATTENKSISIKSNS